MNCPTCNTPKMAVIASRDTAESMYRHRRCVACMQRVTTVELYSMANLNLPLPSEQRKRKEKNT